MISRLPKSLPIMGKGVGRLGVGVWLRMEGPPGALFFGGDGWGSLSFGWGGGFLRSKLSERKGRADGLSIFGLPF